MLYHGHYYCTRTSMYPLHIHSGLCFTLFQKKHSISIRNRFVHGKCTEILCEFHSKHDIHDIYTYTYMICENMEIYFVEKVNSC